jgi:hypothetical protein
LPCVTHRSWSSYLHFSSSWNYTWVTACFWGWPTTFPNPRLASDLNPPISTSQASGISITWHHTWCKSLFLPWIVELLLYPGYSKCPMLCVDMVPSSFAMSSTFWLFQYENKIFLRSGWFSSADLSIHPLPLNILEVSLLFSFRYYVFIIFSCITEMFSPLFSRPLICSLFMHILWFRPSIGSYLAMVLFNLHAVIFIFRLFSFQNSLFLIYECLLNISKDLKFFILCSPSYFSAT